MTEFIPGRQIKSKDHGFTFRIQCPGCGASELWHLLEVKKQFAFFVYQTQYRLECPVCQSQIDLDASRFKRVKCIADIHAAFLNEQITEFEYTVKMGNTYELAFTELTAYLNAAVSVELKKPDAGITEKIYLRPGGN